MTSFEEPTRTFAIRERRATRLSTDLCVVGAGAAGVAAAVEAAGRGLGVCLVDGLAQIGGQSVNGLIGTFCGFFSTGPDPYRLTYGFALDMLDSLEAAGALSYRLARGSPIALYDEHELSAFYARRLLEAGVEVVLGAVVREVRREGDRLTGLVAETRYGTVEIEAGAFVDASGDAVVATLAGVEVQEPDSPVYGTTMFSVVDVGTPVPARDEVIERLQAVADDYGLDRKDGFVFEFPGRDLCLINLVHYETPLDPVAMSRVALEARGKVDKVMTFLRKEFPPAFADARIGTVGQPGIRQTRGIVAQRSLTTQTVRSDRRPDDAIGRCAWPIEFHGSLEGVYWEPFPEGHISWVPLSAMIARDLANLVAAGRCIDAEPLALAAVRVIGPCMAMGAAAAALASTGARDFRQVDPAGVVALVRDNTDRRDPGPRL